MGGPVHLFPVGVPGVRLDDAAPSLHTDPGHSLASFLPPPAAVGSFPNPNTEVKLMCADNTWRAPVAVPDKIFGLTRFLDFIDRGHSLRSLNPPQAALPSLPREDR